NGARSIETLTGLDCSRLHYARHPAIRSLAIIGNDFSIRAIDEDDHRFQRRLTEEHLVSEDESVFENFSVIDLDKHRAGDTNRNFAAVRERRSRSDYQISAMLKTNPGRTGSPLILVGFSKHSTGCPGR